MKKMNKKGFTIVELVIVVAVIAILSAVLIPTFSSVIRNANVSSDKQLVRNLNTALSANAEEEKTMQDALDAAYEFGYDVAKINNTKVEENDIVWNSDTNEFLYSENGAEKGANIWVIASDVSTEHSTYLYKATKTEYTTSMGIDVGNENVTSITYNGAADVIIRTNGGNLVVDSGSVVHYGAARYLTLADSAEYTEKGTIVADVTDFEQETEAPDATWTVVKTAEELTTALAADAEKIMLGDNINFVHELENVKGEYHAFNVKSDVEINLNGYNIIGVHKNNIDTLNRSNVLIAVSNNATLTLSGYGIVSLKYEGTNMQWNALSATLRLVNNGTINVNDAVVVEHLGGTPMSYALDVYATGTTTTFNLNGGALSSSYIAIRSFYQNSLNNKININAGVIEGARYDIWYQDAAASIDVSESLFVAESYKVTAADDLYDID